MLLVIFKRRILNYELSYYLVLYSLQTMGTFSNGSDCFSFFTVKQKNFSRNLKTFPLLEIPTKAK